MKIRIYQINMGKDEKRVAYQGLDELERFQGSKEIDSGIYECVFDGEVDCKGLEDVFRKFNYERPDGYTGHSLSVSDIVEVVEAEDTDPGFYFCDPIGFKKVDFEPDKAAPYEKEVIRVLMVEPGKKAYEAEIGTTLSDIYKALDCDIFQNTFPFDDPVAFVCDDEGKINGSRPNRAIRDENGKIVDVIFGNFFICDSSSTSYKSLPDDMMAKYKEMYLLPERFVKINGEIYGVKFDPTRGEAR